MVEAGSPTPVRSRGGRTAAATLLALVLLLALTASSAKAQVSRDAAAKKALAALGTAQNDDPVIVFGLLKPLRARTVVSQAGPSGRPVAARRRGSAFSRARAKRIRRAGAVVRRQDVLMRVGTERAWFFFEDRGPHQAFEHPGRVVLVGARTGRVRTSEQTRWVPLVGGRQPAFFRNARNYESERYRVLSRPWTTPDAGRSRARTRQAQDTPPSNRQALADALAAEKSCAFRISDTLGDFFDFGRVDQTRARLGTFFEGLERLNAGFVSRRYTTKEGQTPIQAAQALIDGAGCRDLFVYAAGAAPRTGEDGIVIGMRNAPGGLIEWHVLTADDLEALVQANPAVTFKFLFDVPYSRSNDDLIDEPNTVVLLSSGGPDRASFTYLPEILGPNGIQGNPGNPDQLLEFTNAILHGSEAFVRSPAEFAHARANQPGSGVSMMAWMLARAMALSPAWIFASPVELIKLPNLPEPGGPPGRPDVNHAPVPTTPAQPTQEDTPRSITLTANDPDGDPLTFTITDPPDHGKLTGSPPNLTYTPDKDFHGNDAFTYEVADNRGASASQTVQVPVAPDNDAAAVTTTSGGSAAYTEDDAPVAIDPDLTVADPDSSQLEGATVAITAGRQGGDELVFVDQNGITGSYDTGTGVLTLTGSASVADYQAALRSVRFRTSEQNPTASRTIAFTAEDGDEAGAPASRGVTITPVNDAPTVDPTDAALAYTENSGAVALDDAIELGDVDSTTLAGAVVEITGAFDSAHDELAFADTPTITGSYDDSTGTLVLSGTDTPANYEAALRSVTYENVSENPSGSRTVSFQLDDGAGANNLSAVETRGIDFAAVNDAPVASDAGTLAYTENEAAKQITSTLALSDVDDANLELGRVAISANQEAGDDLSWTDNDGTDGITLGSDNDTTDVLTLTGTGTVAQYQAALRAVRYSSTNDNPATGKTISFVAGDGAAESAPADVPVTVTRVNDASTLDTTDAALAYDEGDGPVAVDGGITVTDPDSTQLAGATVQITSNFTQAEDALSFDNTATITHSYDDTTGTLTLTGADTVANYQAALRAVKYENSADDPSTATRTVSFRVDDGGAVDNLSNVATRDIGFVAINDAPVVTTSAGATSYAEGDPGTVVDDAVTLSDADDANLESAEARISSGFESGDDLAFVNTANITGTYDTGTGILTLTGTDTVANYQAALRSITYSHVGDNPEAGKQVQFEVNDGDLDSNAAVKGINITGVNDPPTLNTTAAALSYTEDSGPVAIDTGLTVSDGDSANLAGATVQITSNFSSADDELAFANTPNITGSYDDSTGTLTLSGTDTLANYQAALRSVTYESVSNNPSGSKTVSFQADDGGASGNLSNVPTRDINLSAANDAPTVVTSGGSTSYTEGDPATTIDGSLTVADEDDVNLEGGQVRISSGFESGDDLVFVNQNGITGSYNTGTGVLMLNGTASVADYQTALRSIQFQTTSDNPSTSKTVEFKVNDGDLDSNLATKSLAITRVNDAPTLTTSTSPLLYVEGDGPVAVDSTLTSGDPDSTQFQGATVQITSNFSSAADELAFADTANITGAYDDTTGTLTLSGVDTVANYQTALRSVTYENSSDNPSGSKTVSFQATDAQGAASNVATRDINFTGVNDAPTVTTTAGNSSYTEGGSAATVDSALTLSDPDDTNLESAQVRISNNFQSGDDLVFVNQNGISGVYSTGTGVLTMSGTASKADYQTALRSVQFQTTNDNPSASKTVEFKVNDGDVDSNAATKGLSITPVNDAPTVDTTDSNRSYTEGDGAVAIDNGLTLTDPDSTQIQGATVSITSNFSSAEDQLASAGNADIDADYDPSTGVLTLSGTDTVANYQAVLRAVTYANSSDTPSGSKTISFQATDAEGAASNVATRDIDLTAANDAPVVTTSAGSTPYTEGDVATPVDPALTVDDPDDSNLESGEVRIASNFQVGDVLTFVNQNGIVGIYDPLTGELSLTGTASEAEWQAALRSVAYSHVGDDPAPSKTVEFKVNDGDVDSNTPLKGLNVTGVNDAPTVNTSAGTTAFTEDTSGPVAVDPSLTVADPDSTNLSGATVSITGNFNSSEDELEFTDQNGITGSYDSGTGVLTLSGTAAVADYQTALRSVRYDNTDTVAPSTATRTISFQATDSSAAASNAATKDVSVASVNDAPVIDTSAGSTPYTEDDPATTIDGSLTVSDQDDTNLEGGQVRISSGFQAGDDLVFVNQNGISGAYNTGSGVLTLSGTATVADYQTALRSIQFQSTNQQPVSSKTVEFKVNDGDVDSSPATKEIAVTATNDGPVVDATGTTLAYTENAAATAIDSGLTIDDVENDLLSGGAASITANYAAGQDVLGWSDNNLGDSITLDSVNSTSQTVVLTGVDTEANYQAALRAVTYENTSDNPTTSNRTVTFSATDQPGLTGSDTRTIAITAVDDPPVAVDDPGGDVSLVETTVVEDAAATAIPVMENDTDADGGTNLIQSVTQPGGGTGTVVITGGGTGLTYEPAAGYCNSGGPGAQAVQTFTYTLTPGGDQATVTPTVTCVNDAPAPVNDVYNGDERAIGNTTLATTTAATGPKKTITGNLLTDDTDSTGAADDDADGDGPGPLVVLDAGNDVNASNNLTTDGGTITVESDGEFIYTPAASTDCSNTSDSFNYRVSDQNGTGPGPTPGIGIGTATIDIAGCVWYVKNDHPDAGNGVGGTSTQPFDTLAEAETASGTDDFVFVFYGDGSSNKLGGDGYQMSSGEKLHGEHEGLVNIDPDGPGSLGPHTLHAANSGAHPTLTANNDDVVDLDHNNGIRGFNIDPQGTGGGIFGGSGASSATIDDVNIVDSGTPGTQPGLELDSIGATSTVSNLIISNGDGLSGTTTDSGVRLNNAGSVNFVAAGTIAITTSGAKGLDATGTNISSGSVFDDITVTNSGSGGVHLSNTTGNFALGNGSGTDLELTTSGSTAALKIDHDDLMAVPPGGTANVRATGGPAVDITAASGATFDLDDVDSTDSTSKGINIEGLGTGSFLAQSGEIVGAAGISFDLHGGSGAITYPGDLNNGSGTTAVEITGRLGGAVTFAGPIRDTNDAGGTINVSSNSGGTTTLSNATKQANTGASDGVLFSGNNGHTLNLNGGTLDIDTTSGNGLNAANVSATLEVTGSGNTIDSTALAAGNRALNISGTTISDSDVTFQRVSSSGGLNGIRVNNSTNANGRLFLRSSGSGLCTSAGTCTGGAIQNTSQEGVLLNNLAGGAEFMRLGVIDAANEGIEATGVQNGILLDRSFISSNGNDTAENGVDYNDVTGVTAVRASDLIGSGVDNDGSSNFDLTNTSGTIHLTINDNDFNNASTDDGLQLTGGGTATILSSVTGNRFDNNKGDAIQIADQAAPDVTSHHTITGNTMDGKPVTSLDGGIVISVDGNSRVNASSNTITNMSVSGLILNPVATSAGRTQDMIASNNAIGTPGVQQSGSTDGDGMQLKSATDGTARVVMSNNNIRGWQGAGMRMRASESTNGASTHLTAQGNTIGDEEDDGAGGVANDAGIWLQSGSSAGDVVNLCANVGGAGALVNTLVNGPVSNEASADFVLDLRFANSTMRVPGYTGNKQSYFLGRNSGFTTFLQDGSQNPTNEADGACDQPASPTAPTAPPALGS